MSALESETPSRPERRLTRSSISSAPIRSVRIRCTRTPGSRSPDRVAIMTPDAGVNPIVVSTGRPPATAARLAPAPRCASTTRPAAASGPAIRVSSSIRNAYERP
jgi:hypothetical protein